MSDVEESTDKQNGYHLIWKVFYNGEKNISWIVHLFFENGDCDEVARFRTKEGALAYAENEGFPVVLLPDNWCPDRWASMVVPKPDESTQLKWLTHRARCLIPDPDGEEHLPYDEDRLRDKAINVGVTEDEMVRHPEHGLLILPSGLRKLATLAPDHYEKLGFLEDVQEIAPIDPTSPPPD